MKPTMTRASTLSDFTSRRLSVMLSASRNRMMLARRSSVATSSLPHSHQKMGTMTIMITTTTGPSSNRNWTKVSPVAEPIRMLGGSPIRVAVPPMLEARICE